MKGLATLIIVVGIAIRANAAHYYIPNGDVNSLKLAITACNSNNTPDTIHLFPYSIYKLTTIDNVFISAANALPLIQVDNGNAANKLTIFGNGAKLLLDTAVLSDVRILYMGGAVDIYDLGFINGRASYDDGYGGAIYLSGGTLNLYGCLFKGNSAWQGGAVYITSGNVTIYNCTFTQNNAMFLGGAICSLAGNVFIQNSVIVNNICTNTSGPGAIYNYIALNSPTYANINLYSSIVARNTYQHTSAPNNGLEYDLTQNSGIYTIGNNFIGAYDNSSTGSPPPFLPCLPCSNGDYVGTSANIIDPFLGTFERHGEYQQSYSLLPGSQALINHAGLSTNTNPDIASNGLFPSTGKEGDPITIYGKNLSTIYRVDFEGASITSGITTSDTSVTVTVPPDATTGKITVYDQYSIPATSSQLFTIGSVTPPPPPPVTGLEQKTATEFSIYPNPVSTFLIVNSGGSVFTINDIMGRELLSSNSETVDVHGFQQGIYLIKCGSIVMKFVKN